jgi:CRISPR-associated protein Cas1
METLYVNRDAKIAREDATLVVTTKDGKRRVPVKTLRQVVILGEAGLTTSVLNLLGHSDVRVTVLDWHGNVTGSYEPAGSPAAGRVRLAQARAVLDPAARMVLARTFVEGAVGNILANLRYRAYRGGEDVLKATISEIEGRFAAIAAAEDVTALMGVEGRRR